MEHTVEPRYVHNPYGRAKQLAKSRLFKAEPLPICKMENDCMNDMARCWSFLDRRNYFFKEGQRW